MNLQDPCILLWRVNNQINSITLEGKFKGSVKQKVVSSGIDCKFCSLRKSFLANQNFFTCSHRERKHCLLFQVQGQSSDQLAPANSSVNLVGKIICYQKRLDFKSLQFISNQYLTFCRLTFKKVHSSLKQILLT